MAITKCLIWVPLVNRFTVAVRALRQCGRISDWMVYSPVWMEKIMTFTERELRDDELQQVSGGADVSIGSIHSAITTTDGPGLLSPGVLKVLVESIVGSLASRAAISARSM